MHTLTDSCENTCVPTTHSMPTHIYIHIPMPIHVYTHLHVHIHIHMHVQIHIHIRIHIHIHMHILSPLMSNTKLTIWRGKAVGRGSWNPLPDLCWGSMPRIQIPDSKHSCWAWDQRGGCHPVERLTERGRSASVTEHFTVFNHFFLIYSTYPPSYPPCPIWSRNLGIPGRVCVMVPKMGFGQL